MGNTRAKNSRKRIRLAKRYRLLREDESAEWVDLPVRTFRSLRLHGSDGEGGFDLEGTFCKIGKHIRYCPKRLKQAFFESNLQVPRLR